MENLREIFIEKSKKTHGDKYDYSKVEYNGSKNNVVIICPEHGEFLQTPAAHVRGNDCPVCGNERRKRKKVTTESFIERAKEIFGNRYTYEKTEYVDADTKVCVTCPEHGDFIILPFHHLSGQGCPKCKGKNLTREEIIEKFRKIHGDRYDYSKVVFNRVKEKVVIVCPEHGEFLQTPQKHINGQGCPKCGVESRTKASILPLKTFIERADKVHGGKYRYDLVKYNSLHDKVSIVCPKHGKFEQFAYDHLKGHGCSVCGLQVSHGEQELADYIGGLGFVIETRVRDIIPPYELDMYVPEKKIAVEYNGLRWHSEKFREDRNYHLMKTEMCEKQGIRLVQVYEDEWKERQEIVKYRIQHIFGQSEDVNIETCTIREVKTKLSNPFLDKNHLLKGVSSTLQIGCFHNGVLVGVMCLTKLRKTTDKWKIVRFATSIDSRTKGVGTMIFTYFTEKYNPSEVEVLIDRRWGVVDETFIYNSGFTLTDYLKPDYDYTIENTDKRFGKHDFRKDYPNVSKVWNCGYARYVWKKKNAA